MERVRANGGLDVLINNDAIVGRRKTVPEITADELRLLYETKVFGIVRVTHAFLWLLERSACPAVVNVSSGLGSITVTSHSAARRSDHRQGGNLDGSATGTIVDERRWCPGKPGSKLAVGEARAQPRRAQAVGDLPQGISTGNGFVTRLPLLAAASSPRKNANTNQTWFDTAERGLVISASFCGVHWSDAAPGDTARV